MKIGIITQPLVANYGGILQNYALQQVLKSLGHDPITFNYLPSLSFVKYLLYVGKAIICLPFPDKRHSIKPYRHYLKRTSQIDNFVNNNIAITKIIPAYTLSLLRKNKIKAIIVGSDQVWRYKYNSHNWNDMFLGFAQKYKCRKIAYAASFGAEKWDCPPERIHEAKKLIKLFDAISVREETGLDICREILNINAITTLDPTLLLDASYYVKLCSFPNLSEEPYLVAYVLDMTKQKELYIDSVAKAYDLRIIYLTVSRNEVSIEEWLSIIKQASYVITDSYHGSIFSVIFQKQFTSIINKKRGSTRFATLFSQLGLMNRLIELPNSSSIIEEDIDYSSVSSRLQMLRNNSLSFLKSALK